MTMKLNHVTELYLLSGSIFSPVWWGVGFERAMTGSELDTIRSHFMRNQWVINPSLKPSMGRCATPFLECHAMYLEGGLLPSGPSSFKLDELKERAINHDFVRRRRVGEVVTQDFYKRRSFECMFRSGLAVINTKPLNGQCVLNPEMGTSLPWPRSAKYPPYMDMGNGLLGYFSTHVRRAESTVDSGLHPYSLGVSEDSLKAAFGNTIHGSVDPAEVQAVIADANKRAIDWLTSIAELPETIRYIINGIRAIAGVLKRWSKREESIRQLFTRKREELKKQISDVISLLAKAKSKTIYHQLRKKLKVLNKRYSRLGKELIDALTSAWMQYRYAIMPNVYLIQDVIKAYDSRKSQYFTTRKKLTVTVEPPVLGSNWAYSGVKTCEAKVFLKYRYNPYTNLLESISRVASANFALTAWELGKRSFVIDWFFSVGDALSATFGVPDDTLSSSFCLSYRTSLNGTYVEKNTGAKVEIKYESYDRTSPKISSFTGIYFRPNLNLKRSLDAFSMLWPSLKKNIR